MFPWLTWLFARLAGAWRALIGAAAVEAVARSRPRGAFGEAPTVVAGRFELGRLAGQGGMGKVYRARDLETGAPVAVKILGLSGEEGRLRFEREARLLAELEHPGVVHYVAHGFLDDGTPFLAMEWLEGEDLAERLRRAELDVEESVELVGRLAETLAEVHRRGIIHRDVKPSNVFFEGGSLDCARLLDFGVAHVGGEARPLTGEGVTVGTPGYMAPEQARGEAEVGPRADVFSLGCVLYECLSGRRPFAANDVMGVLLKVVLEEPPPLGELRDGIPESLERLVERMLSKKPEDRPADAAAVARALASLDLRPSAVPGELVAQAA